MASYSGRSSRIRRGLQIMDDADACNKRGREVAAAVLRRLGTHAAFLKGRCLGYQTLINPQCAERNGTVAATRSVPGCEEAVLLSCLVSGVPRGCLPACLPCHIGVNGFLLLRLLPFPAAAGDHGKLDQI